VKESPVGKSGGEPRPSVRLLPLGRTDLPPLKLLSDLTVFGSDAGSDVRVSSDHAHPAHTAVVMLGMGVYACDLGAPGGTSIGGRRIRWARLANGDILAVGMARFSVEMEDRVEEATGEQPGFKLVAAAGDGEFRSIDPALIVGREPGCDVVLADESVAPRHCLIVWTQDGPVARALVDNPGVRLNGRLIRFGRLLAGDRLRIGEHEFVFQPDFEKESTPDRLSGSRMDAACPAERDASSLAVGRLADGLIRGLGSLWPTPVADRSDVPEEAAIAGPTRRSARERQATSAAATPTGRGRTMTGKRPQRKSEGCTVDTTPKTTDQQDSARKNEPGREPPPSELSDPTLLDETENSDGNLQEKMSKLRARVVAAQTALDRRARQHWEQLDAERTRLMAYQTDLRRRAAELLAAAKDNREMRSQPPADATKRSTATDDVWDEAIEAAEQAAGGAEAAPACDAFARFDDAIIEIESFAETIQKGGGTALQNKAAELAELVRQERDEIESAECRLEFLRRDIERTRGTVERAATRHRGHAAEFEAHLRLLKKTETAMRQEREALLSRIRQLDARSVPLRSQIEEANRYRKDLDREAERLAESQQKLSAKEESLRVGLELERQRLQTRQAELQKRATDLAKAAREKRYSIEEELSAQKAVLDQKEAEIKAQRVAIEETGKAELEGMAAELERMLSVRLADIEAEMATRRAELDTSVKSLNPNGEAETKDWFAGIESTLDEDPVSSSNIETDWMDSIRSQTTSADRRKRLAALREEINALRSAVGRMTTNRDRLRLDGIDEPTELDAVAGYGHRLSGATAPALQATSSGMQSGLRMGTTGGSSGPDTDQKTTAAESSENKAEPAQA